MLAIIIGTDPKARSAARRKFWKGALVDIESEKILIEEFASMAATPALFGGAQGYRLQDVLSREGEEGLTGEAVLGMGRELAQSTHTFIFEEEKLLAKPKAALEKAGAQIIELKAAAKKESFNVFSMGNALAARDRRKLWLLLMQAGKEGVAAENVAGILAWKARTMVTSAKDEASSKTWQKLSRDLVVMYHESHRGAGDLALLLERFALSL